MTMVEFGTRQFDPRDYDLDHYASVPLLKKVRVLEGYLSAIQCFFFFSDYGIHNDSSHCFLFPCVLGLLQMIMFSSLLSSRKVLVPYLEGIKGCSYIPFTFYQLCPNCTFLGVLFQALAFLTFKINSILICGELRNQSARQVWDYHCL